MKAKELKKKYIKFFKEKGHAIIESASLIPDNDPTVLFTTAGMHPLVPFLVGQPHPLGKRIVDAQRCIRTQDIDEVGDDIHTTFFEMLGNWSLGDYFKKEAIEWSYEFLTSKKWLGLDSKRISITCFKGDKDAPKDNEASEIWKSVGIPNERIAFLGKKDNWWGPAGETGPCGPDTEMFYWSPNNIPAPKKFNPEDKRWVEIWNDVFMQYNKTKEGKFEPLKQKNVDTGMGLERVAMVLQGKTDLFEIELFKPIINKIKTISGKDITKANKQSFRIITDHTKAATFILGDERGVPPSNLDQGYILRRYIRRSLRHLRLLGVDLLSMDTTVELAKVVIEIYKEDYPLLKQKKDFIFDELKKEEDKFQKTLDKGLKEFRKMVDKDSQITAKEAFLLYQSYGFPIEMIEELAKEKNVPIDTKGFNKEFQKHQELSRKGAEQRFKGGLSEASEITSKLHTATHILGEAIRSVLKNPDIKQKGSNITSERLRYDFNFDRKLTEEELKAIEDEVNNIIKQSIEIKKQEMPTEKAIKSGAQAEFGTKYPPKVWVYQIGNYTKDICMGPHASNTSELGKFKIIKEESSSAGIRRIKAILE
ncbi:MAG: alanine--tRNA ligase [Candidatus Woesearchaeota archaeon]|jgi:alanyl-tRNA synthetase|nr:alanine--tRNA ligase [Candidatus Woesearchaeota archaeon]